MNNNTTDLINQKTKRAMYKEINGKLIIIAKDKRGIPIIIEKQTE